jgi:predicted RecA/RadA family phage recombinase
VAFLIFRVLFSDTVSSSECVVSGECIVNLKDVKQGGYVPSQHSGIFPTLTKTKNINQKIRFSGRNPNLGSFRLEVAEELS